MSALEGGIVKYMFNRERGRKPLKKNVLDTALTIGEEKAAIPVKNQPCELSGQARKSTFLVAFSPDRTRIASTHGDHTVRITDSRTARLTHTLSGHPRSPWCVTFHPVSNDILASGCLGGEVRIWDLRGGGSEVWKSASGNVISSLTFHPTDQVLAFAQANEIHFWDWKDDKPFAQCKTSNLYEKVRWIKFDIWGHHLFTGIANGSTVHRNDSLDEYSYTSMPGYNSGRGRLRDHYMRLARTFENENRSGQENPGRPPSWAETVEVVEPRSPTSSSFNTEGLDAALRYAGQVTSNNSRALRNAREYAAHITTEAMQRAQRQMEETQRVTRRDYDASVRLLERRRAERQLAARYQDGRSSGADNDLREVNSASSSRASLLGIANRQPCQTVTSASSASADVVSSSSAEARTSTVSAPTTTTSSNHSSSEYPSVLLPDFSGPSATSTSRSSWNIRRCARNPNSRFAALSREPASSAGSSTTSNSVPTTTTPAATSEPSLLRSFLSNTSVAPYNTSMSRATERELRRQTDIMINSSRRLVRYGPRSRESGTQNSQQPSESTLQFPANTSASADMSTRNGSLNGSEEAVLSNDTASEPVHVALTVSIPQDNPQNALGRNGTGTLESAHSGRNDSSSDSDGGNACGRGECMICGNMLSQPPRPDVLAMHRRMTRMNRRYLRARSRFSRRAMRAIRRRNRSPPWRHTERPAPATESTSAPDRAPAEPNDPPSRPERTQSLASYIDSEVRRVVGEDAQGVEYEAAPPPPPTALLVPPTSGSAANGMTATDRMRAAADARARHSSNLRSELERLREGISELDREIHDLYTWRQRQVETRMEILRASVMQRREERQHRIEERLRLEASPRLEALNRRARVLIARREREALRERYRDAILNERRRIPQITVTQASPEAEEPSAASNTSHNPTHWRRWHPDMLEEQHAAARRREEAPTPPWVRHARGEAAQRIPTPPWVRRRNLRRQYGAGVLGDDSGGTQDDGFQQAINRAIAGAFMGTGDSAVASNIVSLTYRIQRWNLTDGSQPDISDSNANVIVPHCKLNNDASIDISQDGQLLAVLVPSPRGFPDDSIMAVFSLTEDTLSQCLYTKSFGPNAVSVSISPLNNYILVGLAAKRLQWVFTPKQMVAQVYKMKTQGAGEDSMEHICDLMHPCDLDIRTRVGVNMARWLPGVGEGIIYGTNRGDLHICRPGDDEKDVKERPAADDPAAPGLPPGPMQMQWLRMQMLGLGAIPDTASTATQTPGVRRSVQTQTDGGASVAATASSSAAAPAPVPPPSDNGTTAD